MTNNNYFEVLSNLQALQDLLSEQFNLFLVLVDKNGSEITLPSKLPLFCYENSDKDLQCQSCLATSVARYKSNKTEFLQYHCHHNLSLYVFQTNLTYSKSVYLVGGRTVKPQSLTKSLPLIQAIFSMPIDLDDGTHLPQTAISPVYSGNTYGLTQQELNILSYMVNGLTNQDIASKLFISLNTVKTHIAHILSKLNVANRTEASMFALQNGITEIINNGKK